MKRIHIGVPFSNSKLSLARFIFGVFSIFFFSFISLYFGFINPEYLEENLRAILLGAILLVLGIWAIFKRIKSEKNSIILDDSGINFKNDRQDIKWEDIEYSFLTFVFKKDSEGEDMFTACPFLFLKLKNNYAHTDHIIKTRKYKYPYIVDEKYFKDYIGKTKDFTIAINVEDISEKSSEEMITSLPIKVDSVRPIMEVKTKDEYNKKIYELVDPGKQKDYLLE